MVKRFLPLEANPDVLNAFTANLGLDTSKFSFCDVYGLDEELLSMVPQPCLALLMLFPTGEGKAKGESKPEAAEETPEGLFYMKQTIRNACGTIGMLHAVGNLPGHPHMKSGSFLENFLRETQGMTPAQRGQFLEHPPADAPSIDTAHEEAARSGATAAPPLEEEVDLHFVCFTHYKGRLWELDGALKPGPVDHGPSSEASLLRDAAKVVQKVINASSSLSFNLIALTAVS